MERVVMTVAGEVAPEELGLVLMHEHVVCDVIKPFWQPPENEADRKLAEQPLQLSNLYWASYNVRRSTFFFDIFFKKYLKNICAD